MFDSSKTGANSERMTLEMFSSKKRLPEPRSRRRSRAVLCGVSISSTMVMGNVTFEKCLISNVSEWT